MIVIAPPNAPQIYVPPLNGVEHPLAPAVMNAMLRHGSKPISLWKVVNSLANAQKPDSRAHRRSWRLRYLCACRELQRFKVIYRHGGDIASVNFATRLTLKSPIRVSATVGGLAYKNGGSNRVTGTPCSVGGESQTPENKLVMANGITPTPLPKTESAARPEIISASASALARLPRHLTRKWSGWIGSTRSYRGMPIVLPNGEAAFTFGALRGRVVWSREPGVLAGGFDGAGIGWGVVSADRVQVVRKEHAVRLGRHKRGVRERRSELKAASARANGCAPCRNGKKRGRPPKSLHVRLK